MPLPLRPCGPNCSELVSRGRCPEHTADRQRPTSRERGYDTRWEKFRAAFLLSLAIAQGRPYAECEDCREREGKAGSPWRVALVTDVHHIKKVRDYPHLKLVKSNCRGLCGTCHKARTARGE